MASKDRKLSEWGFHLALLVKRQIAPELKKGTALTDKRFIEIMKRIDVEFENAYRVATGLLKPLKLPVNQNRVPEVTARLLEQMNRQLSTSKQKEATQLHASEAVPLALADGNYVGHVESVDLSSMRVKIKYGPYRVEGRATDRDIIGIKAGFRVPFIIRKNDILVILPKIDAPT